MDDYVIDGDLAFTNTRAALEFYREQYHKKKEWVGLTDEESFDVFGFNLWPESFLANVSQELKDTHEEAKKEVLKKVRAIEAKLKEKNDQ